MYVCIKVFSGSKADKLGLRRGDVIVSTSATAGDNMWFHDSVESVRSALSTRSSHTYIHTYIHTYPLPVLIVLISFHSTYMLIYKQRTN